MKRCGLTVMMVSMVLSCTALCQETDNRPIPPRPPMGEAECPMHLSRERLEMQKQQAELSFQEEMRRLELERKRSELEREKRGSSAEESIQNKACAVCRENWARRHHEGKVAPFLLFCAVIHVMMAVWVYGDIRRRGAGSGIWIAITLLTGLLGCLVYAIVRIGDMRQEKQG